MRSAQAQPFAGELLKKKNVNQTAASIGSLLIVIIAVLFGCATYTNVARIKLLKEGMTRPKVEMRLGKPMQVLPDESGVTLKYMMINTNTEIATPYYFYFDRNDKLVRWKADTRKEIVNYEGIITHMLTPW